MVPSSLFKVRLSDAGSGIAKKGMFIMRIPNNAIPLRLSMITMRSCWLTGAAPENEENFELIKFEFIGFNKIQQGQLVLQQALQKGEK